jgi:NitT/TauT family transport system permease protein
MALITIDLDEIRGFGLADVLVLCLLVALLAGLVVLGRSWGAPFVAVAHIDLAPMSLVGYSLLSLSRGAVAILLSLGLTLGWGLWAAKSRRAEKVLLPLVDILQSIPVLGFMPGLVLAMVGLFPGRRLGLELAAILLIVTSQVWTMILAFYKSCTDIPRDLRDAAEASGLRGWRRFISLEFPAGAGSLVTNGMLAMAGGWFFLIAIETFQLGSQDFRLPGVGSYMAVAIEQGDLNAMLWALAAMAVIVIAVDQLVWRPLLVFAWRFRLEGDESAPPSASWVANFLTSSVRARRLTESLGRQLWALLRRGVPAPLAGAPLKAGRRILRPRRLEMLALGLGALLLAWCGWRLLSLLQGVGWRDWAGLWSEAGLTLARVLAATLIGSLLALPLGVGLGLNPRTARWAQPMIQIVASFPAPMLFPAFVVVLMALGVGLNLGAAALMATATFWTILFHTLDGAAAIPREQREAWAAYGVRGLGRWRRFLIPSLLPSLLVGWETAVVLGWNASIVTEYLALHGRTLTADGLGATINRATETGNFPLLTASVLVMVTVVVATNRLFWHRLFDFAHSLQDKS